MMYKRAQLTWDEFLRLSEFVKLKTNPDYLFYQIKYTLEAKGQNLSFQFTWQSSFDINQTWENLHDCLKWILLIYNVGVQIYI